MNTLVVSLGLLLAAPTAGSAPEPREERRAVDAVLPLVEEGQLAEAEQALHALLRQGEDARARELLGLVLARQGRSAAAEVELRRALALDPSLPDASRHLARLYVARAAPEAADELRRAAVAGPLDRELAFELARLEEGEGKLAAAAQQLLSLADRFSSVRALLQLSSIQARLGDAAASADSLRRAMELAPNAEVVRSEFARAALAARAPMPAIAAVEPLTRYCGEVAEYHYILGVALMQAGDMSAAVGPLDEARRLEPDRPLTLIALGLALNGSKHYDEATTHLMRSLDFEPDNVEALAALGAAAEGRGELEPAEAFARRALAIAPEHPGASLVLGMVRMKQQRYSEARTVLEKAIASPDGPPKAYYQLSLAYARLGERARSREQRELYQERLRAIEDRLRRLRAETAVGTQPGKTDP